MTETLNLAGISLNKVWVTYGAGIILAYILFRNKDRDAVSILLNMLIITLLFWRFGACFFNPESFIKHPNLFLQSYGSQREVRTGILAAVIYLIYKNHRTPLKPNILMDIAFLSLLVIFLVKNLFITQYGIRTSLPWGISLSDPTYAYHPVNTYRLLLIAFMLMFLWRKRFVIGEGKITMSVLFIWGFGNMAISNLEPHQISFLFLSSLQWIYFMCMVLGAILLFRKPLIDHKH